MPSAPEAHAKMCVWVQRAWGDPRLCASDLRAGAAGAAGGERRGAEQPELEVSPARPRCQVPGRTSHENVT